MLRIGDEKVTIYLGSDAVDSIYIGATKIYPDDTPTGNYFVRYTSTDGNVVDTVSSGWGAELVSNTYGAEGGVLAFDQAPTSMPDSAFNGKTTLSAFAMPDTITQIGNNVFQHCSGLTECDLSNVTSMGYNTFASATSLRTAKINEGLTYLPTSTFYKTAIKSVGRYPIQIGDVVYNDYDVKVGANLTSIGGNVFRGSNVEYVWLAQLEAMANSPFQDCTSLKNIMLGGYDSEGNYKTTPLTITGQNTFSGCTALERMQINTSLNTPEYNNSFLGCKGTIRIDGDVCKSATSANTVFSNSKFTTFQVEGKNKEVGAYIWKGNTSLKQVYIDNAKIGNYTFQNCTALEAVHINTPLSIGRYSFSGCTSLSSVAFDDATQLTMQGTSSSQAFANCSNLQVFRAPNVSVSLYLSGSDKFTREAMVDLFNDLATVSSAEINLSAVVYAKLTTADKAIAIQKGWEITYVGDL